MVISEKIKSRRSSQSGFTFIEIMIAMVVASLTILFFVMTQNTLQVNAETAYERKVAAQDAHRLINQMRLTAMTGTFPSNLTSAFPAGATSGYTSMPATASQTMTLAYASTSADPLDVTVTVSWTGFNRRASTQTIRTLITQR